MILRTIAELQSITEEWKSLWRRSPGATPFQSPMWLLPWWSRFGGEELHSVAVYDGGSLTALAPLYILRDEDESLGLLLGTGPSDYLDLLGEADVLPALAEADCQLWDLQQLRPSSPLLSAPTPAAFTESREEQDRCPILALEGELLSTHARKKLRYYRRALEREAPLRFETANEDNLDELLTALYELHAARWRQRNLPGVLADDIIQSFHREAARLLLPEGALRMHAMRIGERIAAVFYGFAHQGTTYYYLSGYDPAYEKRSIGSVLVAHAVDEAVREGCHTFDFLRGAEEYKYSWGAKDRMNTRRTLIKA
ncbi:MAG TPA: GNAT family N-acetyltransferase [Thermoanaerobaculia bacterium]|jgi:CelD/BcsL family acetyltransferase involved in cellulose biosynthesis|nr:GNAT family N-acetyltransferase [Thermoanaerobaculia bacterium]